MTAENTDHNNPNAIRPRWFVAETLVLYAISASNSFVMHNNFVLVHASTLEQATRLAEQRGIEFEDSYTNTDGQAVAVRFIGIRHVHVVHDDLEDGAELLYEEYELTSEADARLYLRGKTTIIPAALEAPGGSSEPATNQSTAET